MGDAESMNLPPGFQFCPTDEELITHFLYRKASRLPRHPNIPDLHFHRSDPSHLQGKAVLVSGNSFYFFSQLVGLSSMENGEGRTENGYWKVVEEEEEAIFSSHNNKHLIGIKKQLIFFLGQPPSAIQTNWFMEQYHLPSTLPSSIFTNNINISSERKKWVLCRVHEHGGEDDDTGDGIELSCLDEMFLSLHDDDDDLQDVTSPY